MKHTAPIGGQNLISTFMFLGLFLMQMHFLVINETGTSHWFYEFSQLKCKYSQRLVLPFVRIKQKSVLKQQRNHSGGYRGNFQPGY